MTQTAGRHSSLTFVTVVHPWGVPFVRALFWTARRVALITDDLRKMQIIHFVRWSLLPGRRLVFEGDFDGNLLQYIDAFAEVVPTRMKAVWATSVGYPGLIPTDGFHRWVTAQEATPGHYYSAYPEASTPMVARALEVHARLRAFSPAAERLDDDAFAAAYERFLVEVQPWL